VGSGRSPPACHGAGAFSISDSDGEQSLFIVVLPGLGPGLLPRENGPRRPLLGRKLVSFQRAGPVFYVGNKVVVARNPSASAALTTRARPPIPPIPPAGFGVATASAHVPPWRGGFALRIPCHRVRLLLQWPCPLAGGRAFSCPRLLGSCC
jgi:hypothetical protein